MRLDAYTHFIPKPFVDKMSEVAGDHKDIGKRMRAVPAIYDLDVRKKVVDGFPDYAQILSYPMPPLEHFAKPDQLEGLCKIINDGFADLCAKEKDRFRGWVAQRPAPACARSNAPSRTARSACRSTPMSAASRSTGPNTSSFLRP